MRRRAALVLATLALLANLFAGLAVASQGPVPGDDVLPICRAGGPPPTQGEEPRTPPRGLPPCLLCLPLLQPVTGPPEPILVPLPTLLGPVQPTVLPASMPGPARAATAQRARAPPPV